MAKLFNDYNKYLPDFIFEYLMKYIIYLILWLSSLTGVAQVRYKVRICPGSLQEKIILVNFLSEITVDDDKLVKDKIANWAGKQHFNGCRLLIEKTTGNRKQLYWWAITGSNNDRFYKANLSILSSKFSSEPRHSGEKAYNRELSCFFKDTVIVLESLRVKVGSQKVSQIILKVEDHTFELPVNPTTNEVQLGIAELNGLKQGKHLTARIRLSNDTPPKDFILYVLNSDQRSELELSLKSWFSEEKPACDSLEALIRLYLEGNFGSKSCLESNLYERAQYEALSNFIKKLGLSC